MGPRYRFSGNGTLRSMMPAYECSRRGNGSRILKSYCGVITGLITRDVFREYIFFMTLEKKEPDIRGEQAKTRVWFHQLRG